MSTQGGRVKVEFVYYGTERLPRVWPPKRSHALTKWMPSDLVGMPHHFLRPSIQLLSSQTFAAWSILGFLTCLCSFSAVCMRLRHFINRPVGLRRPDPGTSQVPTHLAAYFVSLLPPYLCSPRFQLHDTITHLLYFASVKISEHPYDKASAHGIRN